MSARNTRATAHAPRSQRTLTRPLPNSWTPNRPVSRCPQTVNAVHSSLWMKGAELKHYVIRLRSLVNVQSKATSILWEQKVELRRFGTLFGTVYQQSRCISAVWGQPFLPHKFPGQYIHKNNHLQHFCHLRKLSRSKPIILMKLPNTEIPHNLELLEWVLAKIWPMTVCPQKAQIAAFPWQSRDKQPGKVLKVKWLKNVQTAVILKRSRKRLLMRKFWLWTSNNNCMMKQMSLK